MLTLRRLLCALIGHAPTITSWGQDYEDAWLDDLIAARARRKRELWRALGLYGLLYLAALFAAGFMVGMIR